LLKERIKSALYAKKLAAEKTGWRCGRPQLVTPEIKEKVLSLRAQGLSIRKIEKAIDKKISHTAIGRVRQILKPIVLHPFFNAHYAGSEKLPSVKKLNAPPLNSIHMLIYHCYFLHSKMNN